MLDYPATNKDKSQALSLLTSPKIHKHSKSSWQDLLAPYWSIFRKKSRCCIVFLIAVLEIQPILQKAGAAEQADHWDKPKCIPWPWQQQARASDTPMDPVDNRNYGKSARKENCGRDTDTQGKHTLKMVEFYVNDYSHHTAKHCSWNGLQQYVWWKSEDS